MNDHIKKALTKTIIPSLVLLALILPLSIWYIYGRQLPFEFVINPSSYLLATGDKTKICNVTSFDDESDFLQLFHNKKITYSWKENGLNRLVESEKKCIDWQSPQKPGYYNIQAKKKVSATTKIDEITIQVVSSIKKDIPAKKNEENLSFCKKNSPKKHQVIQTPNMQIVGAKCRGTNIVLKTASSYYISTQKTSFRGHMTNYRLPLNADSKDFVTIKCNVLDKNNNCIWPIEKKVKLSSCKVDRNNLFADFSWRLISPGKFHFAAKPSRSKKPFEKYEWDFGEGKKKTTTIPITTYTFKKPKAYSLVKLTVYQDKTTISAVYAVWDRSVIDK